MLGILLCSCRDTTIEEDFKKSDNDHVLINYHFSAKSFGEYRHLIFSLDNLRADQLGTTYRTIFFEPVSISIAKNQQYGVSLGAHLIEPVDIKGFSISASRFVVLEGSDTIELLINDFIYAETDLIFESQDTLDITFELDLENSIVLDSAGVDWINPKIKVLIEQ